MNSGYDLAYEEEYESASDDRLKLQQGYQLVS